MQQTTLFHEDVYEALATDVQALGGVKKVGHRLWPQKGPAAAGEYLKCCLRADRNEKLDPQQIILIKQWAREVNSFAAVAFDAQEVGYEFQVIEPENEAAKLQREFIAAQKQMAQTLARMEKLSLPGLKGVA